MSETGGEQAGREHPLCGNVFESGSKPTILQARVHMITDVLPKPRPVCGRAPPEPARLRPDPQQKGPASAGACARRRPGGGPEAGRPLARSRDLAAPRRPAGLSVRALLPGPAGRTRRGRHSHRHSGAGERSRCPCARAAPAEAAPSRESPRRARNSHWKGQASV